MHPRGMSQLSCAMSTSRSACSGGCPGARVRARTCSWAVAQRGQAAEPPRASPAARCAETPHLPHRPPLPSVMEKALEGHQWLAGDQYSIADIACFSWALMHDVCGERVSDGSTSMAVRSTHVCAGEGGARTCYPGRLTADAPSLHSHSVCALLPQPARLDGPHPGAPCGAGRSGQSACVAGSHALAAREMRDALLGGRGTG